MMKQHAAGASNIDHVQPLNVAYNAPSERSRDACRIAPSPTVKQMCPATVAFEARPNPYEGGQAPSERCSDDCLKVPPESA
jgi:hypothetical protein